MGSFTLRPLYLKPGKRSGYPVGEPQQGSRYFVKQKFPLVPVGNRTMIPRTFIPEHGTFTDFLPTIKAYVGKAHFVRRTPDYV